MDWEHKAQRQAIKDIKQIPAFLLIACLPIDGESVEKLVDMLRKRIKEEVQADLQGTASEIAARSASCVDFF
jgi:hypothetical protein